VEAEQLVSSLYLLQVYDGIANPLLKNQLEEVQQAIRALVRSQALTKLENEDGQPTVDLENQTRVKAINRKVAEFQLDLQEKEEGKEREVWLKKQTTAYKLYAQKAVLGLLLSQNLLLDHKRPTLPLEDGDVMRSLKLLYEQDLENVLKLWQDTRNTNHIKIIRDLARAYREQPGAKTYQDVLGFCKVATMAEIEEKNWSLNPGCYVGITELEAEDFEFAKRLEELHEELEKLDVERRKLKEKISENVTKLLEGLEG
ncbi:MAG: SAM-dependent DNA methyltransferase, partial [Tolypothrix sp. Co-bin9]|nr:SAM-dependent DNA methyltransferase [Tolypothrix sp. Co-bin9]